MEVFCAPCPPESTSLPLLTSIPTSVITTTTATNATNTKPTTTATVKQENINLNEVSPDSGNGEDLDDFDPIKSPVKVSATRCASENEVHKIAVTESCSPSRNGGSTGRESSLSSTHDVFGKGMAGEKHCDTDKCEKQESEMIAYMTKKPELFRLTHQPEQSNSDSIEWQTGKKLDLPGEGACSRSIRGTHYSPAVILEPLNSSLLVSCSQPFQCGSFSSPCDTIGKPRKGIQENGILNLPETGHNMLDANLFSKSYLLRDDSRTCMKPFNPVSKEKIEHFRKDTSSCCDTSYSHQVKTVRNPEYPRCLRSRPARRYTNPEIVRKQPTSGGLLMTSCDLMNYPPHQCTCVHPGTSHACASRLSGKSTLGMLNPMFEVDFNSKQEIHTAVPSSLKKLSLDHRSEANSSGNAEICRSHPSKSHFFSLHEKLPTTTQNLSINLHDTLRRVSESSSGTRSQDQAPPSSTLSQELASKSAASKKKASLSAQFNSLGSIMQAQNKTITTKSESLTENVIRSLESMSCAIEGDEPSKTQTRLPMVMSPEWMDILMPHQKAYTQRLFTPENLHDELFYPVPYGLKSEVYQNLNAREADFVLQKPNRKPRTEPLPLSCVPACAPKRPESPELQDGIIPPLATEDEEALKEGARESRKASLKERRKSSLEKIYIPKAGEAINSILNVKINNFDREEYVKYKKTLSETDSYISERLKFAENGKQSSQDSDSSNKSNNLLISTSQELLTFETLCSKKSGEYPTKSISPPNDDAYKNLQEGKQIINHYTEQKTISNSRMDAFLLKETLKGMLRSHKQILPRQRSLEENRTENKGNSQKTVRKQSLPTEEIFGIRSKQHNKKFSLNKLMSYSAQVSAPAGATFSLVKEADVAQTPVDEFAITKYSNVLFPSEKNEQENGRKNSETRLLARIPAHQGKDDLFLTTSAKPLSGDLSNIPYKETSIPGKKNKTIQRRKDRQIELSNYHPHHHRHYHHQSRGGAHHRPHRTEHLRRRVNKSSSSPVNDKEKKQMAASSRSPKKVPRKLHRMMEPHTNLPAPLRSLEQDTGGDIFTNKQCSLQGRHTTDVHPLVPYEPLVDGLTPTTPNDSTAASGATR